jgi:hypothetical protein
MIRQLSRYRILLLLVVGILAIFGFRTLLAARYRPPGLNDLFTVITVMGSLAVWITGHHRLRKDDWRVAVVLGGVIGVGTVFATLFAPYPFLGIVRSNLGQAVIRGLSTMVAILGGLVMMRQGGPVQFRAASGEWRRSAVSLLIGLALGVPLAVLNVYALRLTQGKPINWQDPLAALLDALQPGIIEEVIYRFAFLGLLWLALRTLLPHQAAWISGLLALLVHNFTHFDDLFLRSPLMALGMGSVMAVIWGLPPTVLALRRDIDSAIAFHWIQDVARFVAGF